MASFTDSTQLERDSKIAEKTPSSVPAPSTSTNSPFAKPREESINTIDGPQEKTDDEQIATPEAMLEETLDVLHKHEDDYTDQQRQQKQEAHNWLTDKSNVRSSYFTNSVKEDMILKYAENFNRQYKQLYPGRKELFLMLPNEFEVRKLVCTTVRPTQLPFKETYDYRSCAAFVAEHIQYECLVPAHEIPKNLASPTYTLKMKSGNCFDMSVLLVSLLRGNGYDAYVVSGYAARDITLRNQTQTSFEVFPKSKPIEELKIQASLETQKYKVKPPKQLKSGFIQKHLTKESVNTVAQALNSQTPKVEQEDVDELKGLRVHAWVLVLPGKREIAEEFFIEPSTGKIYGVKDDNYLGLESVFNSLNYWVNMQVCYNGLQGISFDLGDNLKWEFLLLENSQTGKSIKGAIDEKNDANNSDDEIVEHKGIEIIEIPPSWVEKLVIPQDVFELRSPTGAHVSYFKDAKWEKFSAYHRADGMTSRTTTYESKEWPLTVKEVYSNRKDRLVERRHFSAESKIHEFFGPGRVHALKEHIIINGKTKEMNFYSQARPDGLVRRVDMPKKVLFYFSERDDFLFYRSATFEVQNEATDISEGTLIKVTEKFEKSNRPEKIVACVREYKKPIGDQKFQNVEELVHIFEVDPLAKLPKRQDIYSQFAECTKAELNALQAIKASDREVSEILQLRKSEESSIQLSISIYDTLRNETKLKEDEEIPEVSTSNPDELLKAVEIDYLSPFLVNYDTSVPLTAEDALSVKNSCLKSLKERLVEKTSIIQSQLDSISAEYQKRQAIYAKKADSMTAEETEQHAKFCNEALFKIHILEKRNGKHKEAAPAKYMQLEAKLRNDPRLTAAYQ